MSLWKACLVINQAEGGQVADETRATDIAHGSIMYISASCRPEHRVISS